MNKDLFEALEALCDMWSQYCDGPSGHCFMSAGEGAAYVLNKYKLLKNDKGTGGEVDCDKLEEYRKSIVWVY
ncbi:MAG: hypothetical protein V4615_05015 [Bacteroidota bacterium]